MIISEQIRAARAMLGLKQTELAELAGISINTLNNIERDVQVEPKPSTLRSIQMALEANGVEFISEANGKIGVCRRPKRKIVGHPKLLIIDDSEADRKLYKAWLSKDKDHKYQFNEAGNAQDGYNAFLDTKPDCIILDFMMYGKTGFQMIVEMRRERVVLPPIIFVTGVHTDAVKGHAMTLGIHTYLNKNVLTREKLCEAVGRVFS